MFALGLLSQLFLNVKQEKKSFFHPVIFMTEQDEIFSVYVVLLSLLCPSTVNFLLGKVTQYGSNQPGMCPLCGIAIRQSRNLRRHLLVSCKYRSSLQHAKEFQTPSENRTLSGLEEELADSSCSESNKNCASRDLKPTVVDLITEDETSIVDSIQPEEIVCRPQIAVSSDLSANTENE